MSSTPPEGTPPPDPAPIPPGYQPGDYIPFKDRDPSNPTAVAGQMPWSDQVRMQSAQQAAEHGPIDPYRALYGFDAPVRHELAGWTRRVLAYLFDSFLYTVAAAPAILGYVLLIQDLTAYTDTWGTSGTAGPGFEPTDFSIGLMLLGGALATAFYIYNWVIRQGRTGYTLGKTMLGIRLVGEQSKRPIGAGLSFVRQLVHVVDGLACNLGYLWPIWDARKQTFADKIMNTLVIVQPQEAPRDPAGYEAPATPQAETPA
jgi:uncharacterized RDD family membrane protein YckC